MKRKKKGKGPKDSSSKDPVIEKIRAESKAEKPTITKPVLPKQRFTPGRPTLYRPEFCDLLIWHMSQGLSFDCFGGLDEVLASRATVYDWAKKHPEFLDAKSVGEQKCRQWWESLGNRYSVNNLRKSGESINAQVYKINMQNRFNWMEKTVQADGGKVNLHDEIMGDIHGEPDGDGLEEE